MADQIVLPAWAKHVGKTHRGLPRIEVDPDKFYPVLLKELGFEEIDQYALEVAYQCMKMDLQVAMGGFGFEIRMLNRSDWALKNHPAGRGIEAATFGREARQHYVRIRGALPA